MSGTPASAPPHGASWSTPAPLSPPPSPPSAPPVSALWSGSQRSRSLDGGGPGATLGRRRNMRRRGRRRRRRRVFDYESLGNAGLNREHFQTRGSGEEGSRGGGKEGREGAKLGEERRMAFEKVQL